MDCRNSNLEADDGNLGGPVSVVLENGIVHKGFSTDYAGFENPASLVLKDGAMRYKGNVVFVSDDNGLTVWDTTTGHGVFMNKTQATTF